MKLILYPMGEIMGSSGLLLKDNDVEKVAVDTVLGNQSQERKAHF